MTTESPSSLSPSIEDDFTDDFLNRFGKGITLSGVDYKVSTNGLYVLSQSPIQETQHYKDELDQIIKLQGRITQLEIWFNHTAYIIEGLKELGYTPLADLLFSQAAHEALTYAKKVEPLTNSKEINVNLGNDLGKDLSKLYILYRKRVDLIYKSKKIYESIQRSKASLGKFKSWCGVTSDLMGFVGKTSPEFDELKKFVSLRCSLEGEMETLKHIKDSTTAKQTNDIITWINSELSRINNIYILDRWTMISNHYTSMSTRGEIHLIEVGVQSDIDITLKRSTAIESSIEAEKIRIQALLTSLSSLYAGKNETFTISGPSENMKSIDGALSTAELIDKKVELIFNHYQGFLALPTIGFKGFNKGDLNSARNDYFLLYADSSAFDIEMINIRGIIEKETEGVDHQICLIRTGIFETISMQRALKKKEDEFDQLDKKVTQWLNGKINGKDDSGGSKAILDSYPEVKAAEAIIPKGNQLLKELHQLLDVQKEISAIIQWPTHDLGNPFKGYPLLLTHDVKTLFLQSKKKYCEIVDKVATFNAGVKKKLETFVHISHGLIWAKEQLSLSKEAIDSYLESGKKVLGNLDTICASKSEEPKLQPNESDYLKRIQTLMHSVIAHFETALMTMKTYQLITKKYQKQVGESAKVVYPEEFLQINQKVLHNFYLKQEELRNKYEQELKRLESQKDLEFQSIDTKIKDSQDRAKTYYGEPVQVEKQNQIRFRQEKLDCELRLGKLRTLLQSCETMDLRLLYVDIGELIIHNDNLKSLLPKDTTEEEVALENVTKTLGDAANTSEQVQSIYDSYQKALPSSIWDYIPFISKDADEGMIKEMASSARNSIAKQSGELAQKIAPQKEKMDTRIKNLNDAAAYVSQLTLSLHEILKSLDATLIQNKKAFVEQAAWLKQQETLSQ